MTSGTELVRFVSRPVKAWANGGGSTRVLVDDAQEGRDWTYRVSVADLSGNQPFSRFEGVDRHLTFLGPGSLRIAVNGVQARLDRFQEIRFRGEDAVTSEPSNPTARDLNVMVRRSLRTLTVTPTVGLTTISPTAGAATIWISLDRTAAADKQDVAELDLAVFRGNAPVTVEGRGVLCEIHIREPKTGMVLD